VEQIQLSDLSGISDISDIQVNQNVETCLWCKYSNIERGTGGLVRCSKSNTLFHKDTEGCSKWGYAF